MNKILSLWHSFLFNRHSSPLIIGICIGISISLIQTPYHQLQCTTNESLAVSTMKLTDIRGLRSSNPKQENDDVEQNINVDKNIEVNKRENDKDGNKHIRPRYYSTELGMRDKVLVAVVSTKESISTLGIAVNKTLNHFVDKLIFFLDGTGTQKFGLNIPIVGFKQSKPLIKMFRILSYISENYLNDYDYFLFMNDHTYINGKRLMSMLQQISINQNVHMGLPVEIKDSFYCSLENGIILSQSVMDAVAKELIWCTKNTYSEIDTENFGRCILHASDLPCKSSYQTECFGSYSLDKEIDVEMHLKLAGTTDRIRGAVSVGNVHKPTDMYRLHVYYLQEFVLRTKDEIAELRNKIETTMAKSPLNISLPWPVGSPPSQLPPSRHDLINWETFNETHLFMPSDYENIKRLDGIDLMDIMTVVNASVAHLKSKYSTILHFDGIHYGHRRFDPTRGMDYLISLNFRDHNDQIINKRIEGYRGLTQPEIIPMPYVTENTRVTLLLFVEKNEIAEAENFLDLLTQKAKMNQLTVMFCLLYDKGENYLAKDDPFMSLKSKASDFSKKYYSQQSRASYMHLTVPKGRPSDLALVDLALAELHNDSVILVTEKRAFYDSQFLNRVRMNTIQNFQIFSPIPFVLYHPKAVENEAWYEKRELRKGVGHFDKYYYKHISFYISDYKEARSRLVSIPLFRTEKDLLRDQSSPYEYTIYDMFLMETDLHILRGIEPALILSYEDVTCPESTGVEMDLKKAQCEIRQGLSLGQKSVLSKLVLDYERRHRG